MGKKKMINIFLLKLKKKNQIKIARGGNLKKIQNSNKIEQKVNFFLKQHINKTKYNKSLY